MQKTRTSERIPESLNELNPNNANAAKGQIQQRGFAWKPDVALNTPAGTRTVDEFTNSTDGSVFYFDYPRNLSGITDIAKEKWGTRSDRYKNRQAKKLIRSFVKKVKTEMGIRGNRFGWLGEKLGIGQRPNSPLAGYIKIIRNDLTL